MQNTAFIIILDRKGVNSLLSKPDINQNCDRNGAKLSSMYRIALLTEKILKAQRN